MNITDYMKLILIRNQIVECYYEIYSDYEILKPLDLDEKEDITLDFVNCTVCAAKKNIKIGKIGKNYVLLQPCLRNNLIDVLKNKNAFSNYMSYFTMLGGYHYFTKHENWIEEFNIIIMRQYKFFRKLYPNKLIRLTIPNQYSKYLPIQEKILGKFKNEKKIEILYSNNDEENLKWKYGIENIKGYGIRWEIYNKNNFINCGNDIILFKENIPIGIDFGSGLETLVAVYNENEKLIYSNIVCNDYIRNFCSNNNYNEKLIDCLTSLLCIEYFKKNKNVRINHLTYIYIKIASALGIINEIDDDIIMEILKNICLCLNINDKDVILEIFNKIVNQQKYLYNLSSSKNGEILGSLDEHNIPDYCKDYLKNLTDIEIWALKSMKERKVENVKTRKIEKRG